MPRKARAMGADIWSGSASSAPVAVAPDAAAIACACWARAPAAESAEGSSCGTPLPPPPPVPPSASMSSRGRPGPSRALGPAAASSRVESVTERKSAGKAGELRPASPGSLTTGEICMSTSSSTAQQARRIGHTAPPAPAATLSSLASPACAVALGGGSAKPHARPPHTSAHCSPIPPSTTFRESSAESRSTAPSEQSTAHGSVSSIEPEPTAPLILGPGA
eukprot:scaffold220991_cov32-Tisochrysis_lutea.AAC.1